MLKLQDCSGLEQSFQKHPVAGEPTLGFQHSLRSLCCAGSQQETDDRYSGILKTIPLVLCELLIYVKYLQIEVL